MTKSGYLTMKILLNTGRHVASYGSIVILMIVLMASFTFSVHAQEDLWKELNDKATTLFQNKRYADAIKECEEALKVAENSFPSGHPYIATSKNLLGTLYRSYGRFTEAEPLFKQALSIYENALGPDHPGVATVLQNLADMYLAQDKYSEAEPLYKQALSILENAFGPNDPSVVNALNYLGGLFQD